MKVLLNLQCLWLAGPGASTVPTHAPSWPENYGVGGLSVQVGPFRPSVNARRLGAHEAWSLRNIHEVADDDTQRIQLNTTLLAIALCIICC